MRRSCGGSTRAPPKPRRSATMARQVSVQRLRIRLRGQPGALPHVLGAHMGQAVLRALHDSGTRGEIGSLALGTVPAHGVAAAAAARANAMVQNKSRGGSK